MRNSVLTPKQSLFIAEYLITKNATKAACRAGYSTRTARSAGSRLLANVYISKEIHKGFARQVLAAEISAQSIVNELAQVAFSNLGSSARKFGALELLGRALGVFSRVENSSRRVSALDLLPTLG
jgi:phage terminase small subunit